MNSDFYKKIWNGFEKKLKKFLDLILDFFGIEWKQEKYTSFFQFVRFCMVGLTSAVVMYTSYLITWLVFGNIYIANGVGFVTSTTNSFIWNRCFVFGKEKKQNIFISYLKNILVYAATGLILSNLLLYLWVFIFNVSELLAPLINVLIVTPINFVLNKIWTFNQKLH